VSKECLKLKEHMDKLKVNNPAEKTKTNQKISSQVPQGFHRVASAETQQRSSPSSALHKNYSKTLQLQNDQNQSSTKPSASSFAQPRPSQTQDSSCGVDFQMTGTLMIFLTEIFSDLIELTTDLEKNQGHFFLNTITKHFGKEFSKAVGPKILEILQERSLQRNPNESFDESMDLLNEQ